MEIRPGGRRLLTRDSEVGEEQETAAAQPDGAEGSTDHGEAEDAKAHFTHTHGEDSLQQSCHHYTCESEQNGTKQQPKMSGNRYECLGEPTRQPGAQGALYARSGRCWCNQV